MTKLNRRGLGCELFQLTSSRRGWRWCCRQCSKSWYFNSHPHEEDDWLSLLMKLSFCYFNSHPHEEDDGYLKCMTDIGTIFQLTSSRRGWLEHLTKKMRLGEFQLTSSRRGWRNWTEEVSAANYFNSHPHEEDDVVCKNIFIVLFLFQLTSSRRGWRLRSDRNVYIRNFNSHPHEEDDCSA